MTKTVEQYREFLEKLHRLCSDDDFFNYDKHSDWDFDCLPGFRVCQREVCTLIENFIKKDEDENTSTILNFHLNDLKACHEAISAIENNWPGIIRRRKPKERKRISIAMAASQHDLFSLCNDGTIWCYSAWQWKKLPDIPQGDPNE